MGTTKNVDMSATTADVKVVETPKKEEAKAKKKQVKKPQRSRGKKYQAVRAQVDKTKAYDPFSAVELVKKLSYSKFDGTVVAHAVLREKEVGSQITLTFPHSTGQTVSVAVASDKILAKIEAGEIEFDVLVSTPQYMPKLAKHARVLGPKGLMPNPKNGTLTENPEAKKKELEAGSLTVKTEKKAPIMHVTIGKVSMETKQLVENLQELIDALKNKLVKLSIAASMSPGVKVKIE